MKQNFLFLWIPKNAGKSIYQKTLSNIVKCPRFLPADPKPGTERQILSKFPNKANAAIAHLDVKQMLEEGFMDRDYYDKVFKFCFVRNPFDRFISLFFYLGPKKKKKHKFNNPKDFAKYINENGVDPIGLYPEKNLSHANPQSKWVPHDIDFIGSVENLQKDFEIVCSRIGIKKKKLPHYHKGVRDNSNKTYKDYYDNELYDLVYKIYYNDIERFGYSFD